MIRVSSRRILEDVLWQRSIASRPCSSFFQPRPIGARSLNGVTHRRLSGTIRAARVRLVLFPPPGPCLCASDLKADVDDIAVADDVIAPFQSQLTGFFYF